MMALPKVATSVTSLSVRRLSGNKTGNKVATEWQHYGRADYGLRTTGPEKSPAVKRLGGYRESSPPAKNRAAALIAAKAQATQKEEPKARRRLIGAPSIARPGHRETSGWINHD